MGCVSVWLQEEPRDGAGLSYAAAREGEAREQGR